MQATDILSSEHRVIEEVIVALDAAADRLEAGGDVRPGFFADAVRFIRDYADGYHHAKEEGVLFAAMAAAGMPREHGPVGVMLYEHERARELTAGLEQAVQRWAGGEAAMADTVVDYARGYAELLTGHIFKEDNILFPMAAQVVPAQAQAALVAAFARVESAQSGCGSKPSFVALARSLCDELGVDLATTPRREAALPCHAHGA